MEEQAQEFAALQDADGSLEAGLDCVSTAELLGLGGAGSQRLCPACKHTAPTLLVRSYSFECLRCGAEGDAMELVRLARGCSSEEALAWLAQAPKQAPPAKPAEAAAAPAKQESEKPRVTATPPVVPDADVVQIYTDFLAECRDVEDKVLEVLQSWGISQEVIEASNMRYFTTEYGFLLDDLEDRFGTDMVLESGLLRRMGGAVPSGEDISDEDDLDAIDDVDLEDDDEVMLLGGDAAVGSFADYHEHKAPYLILCYKWQSQPIYLKAIPLVDPARLMQLKLPAFLATRPTPPFLFNGDCIAGVQRVLMFRRELDALIAISHGFPAVAYTSVALFKRGWGPFFEGKDVVLVADGHADNARFPKLLEHLALGGVKSVSRIDIAPGVPVGPYLNENLDSAEPLELPDPSSHAQLKEGESHFVGAVPLSKTKTAVIHRQKVKGEIYFRIRTWEKARGTWAPEKQGTPFLLPQRNAHNVVDGIRLGVSDQTESMPDWLIEHLAK